MDVAAELGMSSERAATLIADALDLRHRLPGVPAALGRGGIEGWRARIVARRTRELSAALEPRWKRRFCPNSAR